MKKIFFCSNKWMNEKKACFNIIMLVTLQRQSAHKTRLECWLEEVSGVKWDGESKSLWNNIAHRTIVHVI